ncbi:MAG TPA: hypothetical protein DE179_04830 [Oceanospirillaceae bacterium]|nr:hypothetical protein [Oceanospirillaceae bacterium]
MYKWHIFKNQRFEWNEIKRQSNIRKHGIDFADAVGVFFDEQAITIQDNDHNEERFVSIGLDHLSQLLIVIYTYRNPNTIRLISARKANKFECRTYERL